jgi:RNA polymerase sigma-70 factor (ECF subfamily)
MSYVMTNPALTPALTRQTETWAPPTPERAAGSRSSLSSSVAGLDDPVLVQRAAAGDVAAFGQLVHRYQRPMAALVSRMTDHADDVDDIVQELFLRAWKGLPRFRGDAQFSTWIYRIAVNTTIKHRSRRRGEATISLSAEDLTRGVESLVAPSDAATDHGNDPAIATIRKEREAELLAAVRSLPEKQRSVVVLHYYDGLSCEEISAIVGCSLGTVWSRLHYACKRLKGVLEAAEKMS